MPYTSKSRDFTNVAAGTTATLEIPFSGLTALRAIRLFFKSGTTPARTTEANMKTEITKIRLNCNGITQREFTPDELFTLEKYRGHPIIAGEIPIRFQEPHRVTMQGQDVGLLNIGYSPNLVWTIEVELASGVTKPSLAARLDFVSLLPAQSQNQGPLTTYRKVRAQPTSTGEFIKEIEFVGRRAISAMHLFTTNIDSARVFIGQVPIADFADKQMLDTLINEAGLIAQSNVWSMLGETVSARHGDILLPAPQPLRLELQMSAVGDFDILIEEVGALKL